MRQMFHCANNLLFEMTFYCWILTAICIVYQNYKKIQILVNIIEFNVVLEYCIIIFTNTYTAYKEIPKKAKLNKIKIWLKSIIFN